MIDSLEDDGMVMTWEDVSKEEEKITVRWKAGAYGRNGRKRKPSFWYLKVSQRKKSQAVGWCTEKMEEKESKQDF